MLIFLCGFISAQTDINVLRNQFKNQYDSGNFDIALRTVDTIIAYWENQNQVDSIYFYRYEHAHTLGQSGESYRAAEEADKLINELEADFPPPNFMGKLYFVYGKNLLYLSEFAKSAETLNKVIAFEIHRLHPDTANIANATEWKGIGCIYTDQLEEAQALVERALELRYGIYDSTSSEIAYSLNSLAGVYYERNMLAETNTAYEEAYRIFKLQLPADHPHILTVASNLSNVKSGMGEIHSALELLEDAIAGHEKQNAVYNLINEYHSLGSIYVTSLHDSERARVYFMRSLNLVDSLLPKPHFYRANIYDGLGGTYLHEQNYLKADSFFLLAYREREMMNEKSESGLGQSTYNLGITSEGMGDIARATKYYTKSLAHFSASFGENHPKAANAMSELANLDWLNDEHDKALKTYRKCLEIYTANLTPRHAYPLQTAIKLAKCFDEINEPDSTDLYLRKAWEGVCDTKGESIILESLSEYPIAFVDPNVLNLIDFNLDILIKKRSLRGSSDSNEDVELMKTMDKLMAELWPMLNFENETSSLLPQIKAIYRKGVLLASLDKTENEPVKRLYLNSLEQSHSASIRSALLNREAMHYANVPDSIVEKDRRLREKLRFVKANAEDEQDEFAEKLSFNTLNEWRTFQKQLQEQYPEWYSARYAPEIPKPAELQNKLAEAKASLVAYFAGDTSVVILHVDGDQFHTTISSLPPAWRDSVLTFRKLTEQLAAPERLAALSYYLYTLFWQPIEGNIKSHVMLIPDGALHFLNFETLISSIPKTTKYANWDWLIKKHSFLYRNTIPGKERPFIAGKNEVLALAPGFSYDLKARYRSELDSTQTSDTTFTHWLKTPWSVAFAKELEPKGKTFVGMDATKKAFRENAAHAEILHFGTHAQLNDSKPLNSFLVLTPQPQDSDDGYLYAYELYDQPLNAQLAILTACETGLGQYREGDGVISLAHAFQYAGCPNVVYSLWQIDDKQSTWLIKQFYAHMNENQNFSDALRHAKLDYLNNHSDELNAPYYWGGVVLTGSDGKLTGRQGFARKYWWMALIGGCAFLFIVLFHFRKNMNT